MAQDHRKALATDFGRVADGQPSSFAIPLIRLMIGVRHPHQVILEPAAVAVTLAVGRVEVLLRKLLDFLEHHLEEVL